MATLRKPRARVCEQCGRRERWDEDVGSWQIDEEDGNRTVGDPYCIHEWNITGTFSPVAEDA